jgi:hypothetical protein
VVVKSRERLLEKPGFVSLKAEKTGRTTGVIGLGASQTGKAKLAIEVIG